MRQYCLVLLFLSYTAHGAGTASNMDLSTHSSGSAQSIRTAISACTKLNRLKVNDQKSSRIQYKTLKFAADYDFLSNASFAVNLKNLDRIRNDFSTGNTFTANSIVYSPTFSFTLNDEYKISVFHNEYQTNVTRENFYDEKYSLNTGSSGFRLSSFAQDDQFLLAYYSEARSEHEYLFGEYPLIDREYIPAQVDLTWFRSINSKLVSNMMLRYSHYNHDEYEDQYDSDIPTSPTLSQVFDYLLTFSYGLTYSFYNNLDIEGGLT